MMHETHGKLQKREGFFSSGKTGQQEFKEKIWKKNNIPKVQRNTERQDKQKGINKRS